MINLYKYTFYLLYRFAKRISDPIPRFYACLGLIFPSLCFVVILLKLCWMFDIFTIDREGLRNILIFGGMCSTVIFGIHWKIFVIDKTYLTLEEYYEKRDKTAISLHTVILFVMIVLLAAFAMFLPIHI